MAVRDFDRQEYALFAGAENFPCGGCPLVDASDEELLFIGSKAGVEIFSNNEDGESVSWFYRVEFPTKEGCWIFMNGLPGSIAELEEIGFKHERYENTHRRGRSWPQKMGS